MVLEEFEDAKGAIRIRISKKNQTTQWPKEIKLVFIFIEIKLL
jgi:hypothetical protein